MNVIQTNMSTILILLIFVWSQISGIRIITPLKYAFFIFKFNYFLGNYVIALFIVGDDKNTSTMDNESCISCICKPMTRNCDEVCIIITHKYV